MSLAMPKTTADMCNLRVRHVTVQEIRAEHLPQDQVLKLLSAERGALGRGPGMQPSESRYILTYAQIIIDWPKMCLFFRALTVICCLSFIYIFVVTKRQLAIKLN